MVMKAPAVKVIRDVLCGVIRCIFLPIVSSRVEGRPAWRRLAAECKCARAFVLVCTIQLICARSELIFLRLVFPQYHRAAWWDSLAWICQEPHWEQPVNDKVKKKKRRYSYLQNTPLSPQEPISSPETQLDTLQQIHHQHWKPSAGILRAISAILITFPTSRWVYYNPVWTPGLSAHRAWEELAGLFVFFKSSLLINDVLNNLLSAAKLIQRCCLRLRRWWTCLQRRREINK